MTGAWITAVLLAAAAAAAATESNATTEVNESAEEELDSDDDGEGDMAPFMIVVEHSDGWRCSGALVSLRMALTSAWCARGRGVLPARELWALAAAAAAAPAPAAVLARRDGARRVSRVAVASGADAELTEGPDPALGSWRGGAMDLAIIELDEPFGAAALARPILMSTSGEECVPAEGTRCHVSRAIPREGSRHARLRIVSEALVSPDVCAGFADHWAGVRDRALCLVGSELCESDWGGGVVCGGKLCGVLSRSVRDVKLKAGDKGAGGSCGNTHAAQSVARWRRFLHCAHTLRACGRGGDCADLCVERRLIDEPETEQPATKNSMVELKTRVTTQAPQVLVTATIARPKHSSAAKTLNYATRTSPARRSPPTRTTRTRTTHTAEPAPPDLAPASDRPSFEFEPNRPDFKAAPSRPTRVYLKAGEYGDNAADYGGDEPAAPAPSPAPAAPGPAPTRTAPPVARASASAAAPEPQDSPPAERRSAPAKPALEHTSTSHSSRPFIKSILILFMVTSHKIILF